MVNVNWWVTFVCLASAVAAADRLVAAPVTFTVDSAQSYLAINPTTNVFATVLPTSPQGPGSFKASYSGSLVVDLTATTMQILSSSTLIAGNSGNWLPGTDYSNYPDDLNDANGYISTPAPANYGIVTDLTALGAVLGKNGPSESAIRELQISLVDDAAKPLVSGTFEEAGITTDFTAGTVYYASGGTPPITDLANTVFPQPTLDAAGTGTLVQQGNLLVLTLPIDFKVTYPVAFLALANEYQGVIVATAWVPEPTAWQLALAALGLLFGIARRG